MGGSYLDSGCRLVCAAIQLITFCFFAFYRATTYRVDNGLVNCLTLSEVEQPLDPDLAADDASAFDVSSHWILLFYFHIATAGTAVLQILIATMAYQKKESRTCCDRLLVPATCLHCPVSLGVFVWVHVVRFNHSGKVCAGDFLTET